MRCIWNSSKAKIFVSAEVGKPDFDQEETGSLHVVGRACSRKKTYETGDVFRWIRERDTHGVDRYMRSMNGLFSVIQIDSLYKRIHIISDHLGFYPLYCYQDASRIMISSSLRLFYLLFRNELHFDAYAFINYVNNGHLLFGQSWFQEVKRLSPGSIHSLHFEECRMESMYYWSWDQIKKSDDSYSHLSERYIEEFNRGISDMQIASGEQTIVSLSGGLDSRWIACTASRHFQVQAFSFSMGETRELLLARKVAGALGIPHRTLEIRREDWLRNRLQMFWESDGMLHLGHLHEGNITSELGKQYNKVFHGFFGGGIYASRKQCNKPMSDSMARTIFRMGEQNSQVDDVFIKGHGIDAYIIQHRMRYQSAYSLYALSKKLHLILPFYNMDWLEVNYSLDDNWQLNSKFYLEALHRDLDKTLLRIPWQRTGVAPMYVKCNTRVIEYKVPQLIERIYTAFGASRHFINYKEFEQEIAYWMEFFKQDIASFEFQKVPVNREVQLRKLSLAVWFRMLKEGRYEII